MSRTQYGHQLVRILHDLLGLSDKTIAAKCGVHPCGINRLKNYDGGAGSPLIKNDCYASSRLINKLEDLLRSRLAAVLRYILKDGRILEACLHEGASKNAKLDSEMAHALVKALSHVATDNPSPISFPDELDGVLMSVGGENTGLFIIGVDMTRGIDYRKVLAHELRHLANKLEENAEKTRKTDESPPESDD